MLQISSWEGCPEGGMGAKAVAETLLFFCQFATGILYS
jgi:hypothetical protein